MTKECKIARKKTKKNKICFKSDVYFLRCGDFLSAYADLFVKLRRAPPALRGRFTISSQRKDHFSAKQSEY
jgi:hypothetical protein